MRKITGESPPLGGHNGDDFNSHLPCMWTARGRDHAHGCLPFLLRLPTVRHEDTASSGGLLRVLFLRQYSLPAKASGP